MGLGRVKKKREKILLEKQTPTSTITQIYRPGCYIDATVQYVVFYLTATVQRERKRKWFSIHKKRLQ